MNLEPLKIAKVQTLGEGRVSRLQIRFLTSIHSRKQLSSAPVGTPSFAYQTGCVCVLVTPFHS